MESLRQGMFATGAFLLAFLFLFILRDGHAAPAPAKTQDVVISPASKSARLWLAEAVHSEELRAIRNEFKVTVATLRAEIPGLIAVAKEWSRLQPAQQTTND